MRKNEKFPICKGVKFSQAIVKYGESGIINNDFRTLLILECLEKD